MNILLTGARAPATLELARAFQRAGHSVFTAESFRGHLSESSNAVRENFLLPPPRQQTDEFIAALQQIITNCKIDFLIPACEEIFYVAMGRDKLHCKVFVEPIRKLDSLHNKWKFFQTARGLDLAVPQTTLIAGREDLLDAYARWNELVLKPIYSRFAAQTLILPLLAEALSTLTFDSRWLAQEFVHGNQICTYGVCHNGRITAHTAYRSEFTAGQGATIVFQHVDHPAAFDWVQTFVRALKFTGQIAFDFMETPDGRVLALECNPRATSGIHTLASNPDFVNAFFDESLACVSPLGNESSMLSMAMPVYELPVRLARGGLRHWLKTFFTSRDVIFRWDDPKPFFFQVKSILHYLKLARRHGISPLAASTYDIEWNGEIHPQ